MRTAVVLGGAACVWADAVDYAGPWDGTVAANDIGVVWPDRLDAWCSMHPEKLRKWAAERQSSGLIRAPLWSHRQAVPAGAPWLGHITPAQFGPKIRAGNSGLFAAKIAMVDLGFDRVVFCGCPMEPTPHFYGGEAWRDAEPHWADWLQLPPEWRARMRSMSGRTRELLGAPDGIA